MVMVSRIFQVMEVMVPNQQTDSQFHIELFRRVNIYRRSIISLISLSNIYRRLCSCIFFGPRPAPTDKKKKGSMNEYSVDSFDPTQLCLVATIFSLPGIHQFEKVLKLQTLYSCQWKNCMILPVKRLHERWVMLGGLLTHYVFNWDPTKALLGGILHGAERNIESVQQSDNTTSKIQNGTLCMFCKLFADFWQNIDACVASI